MIGILPIGSGNSNLQTNSTIVTIRNDIIHNVKWDDKCEEDIPIQTQTRQTINTFLNPVLLVCNLNYLSLPNTLFSLIRCSDHIKQTIYTYLRNIHIVIYFIT